MTHEDPPKIDTSAPHEARIYDYWLGGKDNYAADRVVGDAMIEALPALPTMARANRNFMERVVRHLSQEAGIRQFLDIGTGIPTSPNVHEIAQETDPSSRVLYVDDDPLVLAHARALMTGSREGRTAFLLADALDPEAILASDELAETLDLDQPVALLIIAVLMYFDPAEGRDPYRTVRTLLDALPSGSYVAITHPTGDFSPETVAGVVSAARQNGISLLPRTKAEVERFLDGTELVEPGIVPLLQWHPTLRETAVDPHSVWYWGAVGRRP